MLFTGLFQEIETTEKTQRRSSIAPTPPPTSHCITWEGRGGMKSYELASTAEGSNLTQTTSCSVPPRYVT